MLATRPLDNYGPAAGSRSYVRWNVSLDKLNEQLDSLQQRGAQDSCILSAVDGGVTNQAGAGPELPLTLGELKQAINEISARDSWLIDRDAVSLYTDRQDRTHLDVVSFGGFILAEGGHLTSRSVNPW